MQQLKPDGSVTFFTLRTLAGHLLLQPVCGYAFYDAKLLQKWIYSWNYSKLNQAYKIFLKHRYLCGAITMKSFFILVFSLNLFTGGILFGELAKLPALSLHYRLHQNENANTTFAQFLWLHYFDGKHANDATHDHNTLPFHHNSNLSFAKIDVPVPTPVFEHTPLLIAEEISANAAHFYYSHYLPVGFTGSVFQPPRA
jgi:hypothetical protein